jgi:putative DNA primase/helicase
MYKEFIQNDSIAHYQPQDATAVLIGVPVSREVQPDPGFIFETSGTGAVRGSAEGRFNRTETSIPTSCPTVRETPVPGPSSRGGDVLAYMNPFGSSAKKVCERRDWYTFSDLGNARRFVLLHGKDLRYCPDRKSWLIWDGNRWFIDDCGRTLELAKTVPDVIRAEIDMFRSTGDSAKDNDLQNAVQSHLKSSQSWGALNAMLRLAQTVPNLVVREKDLDADDWLLGTGRGIIDLHSGKLVGPRREDLITKSTPVQYDQRASCPTWLAFLERIMAGNADLIAFLQRAVGYSLTANDREQAMFILHGAGRNGKSTFIEIIHELLGDYALRTPTETLIAKEREGIPNDVARLNGARFVHASEADKGRKLSEGRIKDMTGGDTISARFMRGEWFDFKPKFKLWLCTNYKPVIEGTDDGIWRRIRLVPFSVTIPPEEQDRDLPAKLRAELPGILNWAIEGCLDWQRNGLGEPPEVHNAVSEYRAEMDTIGRFIEECCTLGPNLKTLASDLFTAYQGWSGDQAMNQKNFGSALRAKGFERVKSGVYSWHGIGLTEAPPTTE